jgi:hypothetical protein
VPRSFTDGFWSPHAWLWALVLFVGSQSCGGNPPTEVEEPVCPGDPSCPPAEPVCPGDPSCPPDEPVDLAAPGPCGQESVSFENAIEPANLVHVFSPTGSAATPLTGGTCADALRPVLFLSHGYLANDPSLFSDLIQHFVSQGHIVVFAEYCGLDTTDLDGDAYVIVDAGFEQAATEAPIALRGDLGRVGFMGHSMGGGMVPYLLQQAEPRGWGDESIWAVLLAPYWALAVGDEATIDVPEDLHALVVSFDEDAVNDNAIAAEIFVALDMPLEDKDYVLVQGDAHGEPALVADHVLPQTKESTSDDTPRPDDALRIYGVYRNANALAACAMFGTHCDVDRTFMGVWSDEVPVTPATVTDSPGDSGIGAVVTCTNLLNPRHELCP